MKKLFAVATVLCAMTPPCLAGSADQEPNCSQWAGEPPADKRAWLSGFLAGASVMWEAAKWKPATPFSQLAAREEAYAWLDRYCQANPSYPLSRGGIEMLVSLSQQ